MPEYRRSFVPGGTYFFTVVTFHRLPILVTEEARKIFHWAWMDVNQRMPFTTDAICLLPEHLHCIWTLPAGDTNYSIRWKEIKRLFSREYGGSVGVLNGKNASREKRGEATIWQRRFWEPTIRDEKDMEQHLNYIHYNPVKHGHVDAVRNWEWSSFHRYVRMGYYDIDWGSDENNNTNKCGE